MTPCGICFSSKNIFGSKDVYKRQSRPLCLPWTSLSEYSKNNTYSFYQCLVLYVEQGIDRIIPPLSPHEHPSTISSVIPNFIWRFHPVSYTHLDVYKRQGHILKRGITFRSPAFPNGKSSKGNGCFAEYLSGVSDQGNNFL